ncbi:shikimate dehydrogenase family protein [Gardnerella vaginalis]|uniref:shikimate dehydrogenase family protein n=1 Tax=Gardnerella vaginalis TaxID=2702 RepID=UPI000352E71E|nr:shikimate dehydrogenase substrate-binding domain protein [Gardnerella vaginalis]EPI40769.1 shikimate dehydrogenase substrate binding domain protein [Gardnerella vaginalis JCP8481B]EPI40791.1 shikimate dehydrogenase substrate binding domain protein [Gardnerella vaginalis JCP8481A]
MSKIYHCAVLGNPIAHSLSPVLHNAAYQALGLTNWQYSKKKVSETELADFISNLDDSWKGLSLTMPLKKTIMKLGTPCDYWSKVLNVANTAIFTSNPATASPSQIELCNTDVSGIIMAFIQALHERITGVKKAVIIGSGNTASSAMAALIEIAQASKLEQVQVVARTESDGSVKGVERFNNLLRAYCADSPNSRSIEPCLESSENESSEKKSNETDANYESVIGIEFPKISEEILKCDESLILQSLSSLDAIRAIAEADIVISTVPAHVADGLAIALKAYCKNRRVKSLGTLLDVVYDPRPSMLLSAWRQYGLGIGGEEMLLYQALEQVKLMTFEYRNSKEEAEEKAEEKSEEKTEVKSEVIAENISNNDSDKTEDYDNSKDPKDLIDCMRKALQEAL